jgi:hypothetical protein
MVCIVICSCGSSPAITLTNADAGRTVALHSGEEVDVELQTIGPGQYGTPSISSSSVMFIDTSLVPPYNPGGPRQLYRFRTASVGAAEVSIPAVGTTFNTPPFAFSITVN